MITLDYSLDPAPNAALAKVDLATADETVLRYRCFLGDVVFIVGEVDLSARWGWVPILDFAVALAVLADGLTGKDRFEFTESGATIDFHREANLVHITADYAPGAAKVPLADLQAASDAFLRQVVADLTAQHPDLARNNYVTRLGMSS